MRSIRKEKTMMKKDKLSYRADVQVSYKENHETFTNKWVLLTFVVGLTDLGTK